MPVNDWKAAVDQLRGDERDAFDEYVRIACTEARRDAGQMLIEQARRNWRNIVTALRDLSQRPTSDRDQ